MKMIAGLGNPGYEYHSTPHNLGFMAVDRLAGECGLELEHREAQALTAAARLEGLDVLLAKPQTYMNLSGMAVARLVAKYGLDVGDLIVLVDDAALPLGSIRIRPRGSAGGHNGLKSLIGALDSGDFVRVRMGVRPEQPVEDMVSYVLGRFREADLETVAEMLSQACEAVHVILREGSQKAMNRFNRRVSTQPS
ncbi:MAG TPA: aminoacyl-tRNA hydrolase [Terriglobia bacterium]|nr:aminoacyl-tRNA hydrolase [Terriglobia bacterium]